MQPLIKMENIFRRYMMGEVEQTILRGVNLEVFQHELVAIMGASGSGKSTLMNIIGLLDRQSSGTYLLNNQDVATLTDTQRANLRNKTIGFVFQSFFLLPKLTILENVALPLYYRQNYDQEASYAKAIKLLERMELGKQCYHRPSQLSGGQQQRAAIARALIGNPTFLLADEPTGALDQAVGKIIMEMFIELNQVEKATIIIITHDPDVAVQCGRTLHIRDGVIV